MTRITKATVHSIDRAKERFCNNEKTAIKNIHLALERGKVAEEFSSKERQYLESVAKGNVTAIAYNNFCYIVNEDGFCVTMYHLPDWFGKKRFYDGKKEIRNPRAYSRNNISRFERGGFAYA